MGKRVLNFKEYLTEQAGATGSAPETDRQKKSRIAASLVKNLLGDDMGLTGSDSNIEITKEVKDSMPDKGCGASEPYPLKKTPIPVSRFKEAMQYLSDEGMADYSKSLKELEEGRALIIGLRNRIEVKREDANQDRFIDGLYFIPQNAQDTDTLIPYQITTAPSLRYYGEQPINPNGTGIKLPGDTLYYYKESTIGGSGGLTYKMMVEGEKIKFGTYAIGVTKFENYKPSTQAEGYCGMQIHKSSTKGRGICVGAWSAGCQVFADGDEWNDFTSKIEKQTTNGTKFYYVLLELDAMDEMDRKKGSEELAASKGETETTVKKKEKKKKS